MSLWGRIFARFYDRAMAATEAAGLADRRGLLLAEAAGAVVEIGAGTGANLTRYPSAVQELVLVEPEAPMVAQLHRRIEHEHAAGVVSPARVVQAPAEAIPLPDASFDVAVSTLVLCTVRDPAAALAELRRLLRPGGRLLFIEHVRAEDPALSRWQDRLAPVWRRVGHGCNCNRATLSAIQAAGFTVERVELGRLPKAPKIVRPMIAGVAVAPLA
jgi:ubiquinone/menaquinone biosynthesis C-methylase UbiE